MTGNNFDGFTTHGPTTMYAEKGDLQVLLDLLWIKLNERFMNMAEAFRFFDKNYNNRVHFSEFQKSLDNLRIKFRLEMMEEIFKKLDRGDKGYFDFNDFAQLSEEKRRNIDPFHPKDTSPRDLDDNYF